MSRKNLKSGFTLVELMAFFIFISLLLAASTPIITKKVRDLPKKISHGMYICYRDGDVLVQDYYNASKRVRHDVGVASCSFNAPKSAAMFKIDVIGAGAGGYDYYKVVSEEDPRSGTYHLDGTTTNDTIVPSNDQLRELMQGQKVTRAVYTGEGGDGYGMRFSYAPPVNVKCTINSGNYYTGEGSSVPYCAKALEGEGENAVCPEGWTNLRPDVLSRHSDMVAAISADSSLNPPGEYKTYISSVDGPALNGYCSSYGLGSVSDVTYTTGSVSGTDGGEGKYLVANYTIDLTGITDVKGYLASLVNKFSTGSSSAPGGSGFTSSSPGSGKDHNGNRYYDGAVGSIWPAEETTGGNVTRYAAIRLPDGSYVTNEISATGGEDVRMKINSTTGILEFYNQVDGQEASGTRFSNPNSAGKVDVTLKDSSSGSVSSYTPSVSITMAFRKRVHTVGNGGGAGAHEVAYVSTLGNGCNLIVPSGGAAINEGVATDETALGALADDLNTTISCGDGGFALTAVGGNYTTGTVEKEHSPYDFIGDLNNPPPFFSTDGEAGQSSRFDVGTNVYTKYFAADASVGYGAGGNGVKLKDSCTQPQGSYSMTSGGKEVGDSFAEVTCTDSEKLTVTHATKGTGGAVIISW